MLDKNLQKFLATVVCFGLFLPFCAQALDITSTENVTISANVGGIVVPATLDGGGTVLIPSTAVRFSGLAYPNALVSVMKDGKVVTEVVADLNGNFSATLAEEYSNTILYSVVAKDLLGNKSILLNYPLVVRTGYLTHVSGILFAPTIVLDKAEVKRGDFLRVYGSALPNADLEIKITDTYSSRIFSLISDKNGKYEINIPTTEFILGEQQAFVKYKSDSRISKIIKFLMGTKNVLATSQNVVIPGDCNKDSVINLIDFSILAFWYKKNNPPICVDTNRDNIVDLIDFSILAFYWTG